MVDGQKLSITARTKKEAEQQAAAVKSGAKAMSARSSLTVGQVIDRYIDSKDAILSPTTINGYRKMRRCVLQDIMDQPAESIKTEMLQRSVNRMAKDRTPKYVHNAYGLFTAAMAEYYPDRAFRVALPQKEAPKIHIPTMDEISRLHQYCSGSVFELPFLLAVWLGLRTSEIRGLTWDCIDGDTLIIKQALVNGEAGPVLKQPKTYSGNRRLRIPPYIKSLLDQLPRTDNYVTHFPQNSLYRYLQRACDHCGVPRFRFHDLRHVNASVMLELNVPDKYAMERMGHATNNMLKTVYQHTMDQKAQQVADQLDDYFGQIFATEFATKI